MTSKMLQKARDFEKKYLPYTASEQPLFHLTGGIGWINDPNGFAPYKGEYHLFFQYYPYNTKWGPMHWGHVKTKDFIRWERLPAALAPDTDYDRDGCFSGSSVELPDGRQLLMYTGVRNIRRRNGMIDSFQTQCLAIGDGIDYEKLDLNPVIDATLLPEGGSEHDFRDPKIWRESDKYYAVVGNRCADGSGTILLYQSKDALNWEYVSVLAACHNQYGRMWECPDFFPLDGKHVLLVSPQEMAAIGLEFHPGNANVCLIGKYDRKAHHLNREYVQAIDYGLDFYAPQTLLTEDGRRVMIAWMQNWETSSSKPQELRFMGQMTLPRELSVRNGRLFQNPVRELESCRGVKIDYHNVLINGEASLRGISGRCMDMTVTVRPGNERSIYKWFRLYVAKDGENFTMIRYRPDIGTLKVDRTHSGFPHDIVNIREFPVRQNDGEIKIRVVMDRYSMELFVNDGEQAASFVLYTPQEANAVSFSSDGSVLVDVEKYDLEIK
ncbi:MAG: glycoside hydrolase family 32 protein [Lachnospiraceae bacterium]|nr:glycoside hydrolase family 32 protein [Oscillospiraceae bacterium]MBQ7600750.1 glycoside hydrolase family 32 protein [Lachnospiraceae bacterium]